VIDLAAPFFSWRRGEWVEIDWASGGIAGMDLLLDLNAHLPVDVALKRFEEARAR
jgi:hypothetical protein